MGPFKQVIGRVGVAERLCPQGFEIKIIGLALVFTHSGLTGLGAATQSGQDYDGRNYVERNSMVHSDSKKFKRLFNNKCEPKVVASFS